MVIYFNLFNILYFNNNLHIYLFFLKGLITYVNQFHEKYLLLS